MTLLENHLGVITWMTTVVLAVATSVLKFGYFAYQSGKLSFWSIDRSAISMAGDSIIYEILLSLVLSAVLLFVMLIPIIIERNIKQKFVRILLNISIVIIISIIIFVISNTAQLIDQYKFTGLLAFLFIDAICVVLYFAPSKIVKSMFWPQESKKHKTQEKNVKCETSISKLVVAFGIWLVVMVCYLYGMGYLNAKYEEEFRITTDGYAIIYETDENFYLAKYDEEAGVVKEYQKVVQKTNVEFFWEKK